jgi:hypothetical protein
MYIYGGNTCSVNNECESGYSLYFPCVGTLTRGENACFDFYIVDNATKKEVDLREVDDITLNMSGRYNCNFGSYSYPENINTLQIEKFSELVYSIDFSDIINHVKLYIDIVDEKHQLIKSYLFDEDLILDIAIEGAIGYFLNGSENNGVLNLKGYDTKSYIFLGWNIDESDGVCNLENIYDFLIKSRNLVYNVGDDLVVRAVYQNRREYTIQMSDDNFKSIYPEIKDHIFVDEYYIDNIYVNNCEIDVLNDVPYIKIIEGGYIQIININKRGNFKLSLNNVGGDCMLFIDNHEVPSSAVENNEFIFEFDGGIFTLTGKESCIFGLKINKEVIYERGKCMLCFSSEDTLKFYPGDLTVEGGVIVNGNPYGISSVNFAKVTDIKPLIIKNNTI